MSITDHFQIILSSRFLIFLSILSLLGLTACGPTPIPVPSDTTGKGLSP